MNDNNDFIDSNYSLPDLPDISQSNEGRINISWTNIINIHTSAESNNDLSNSFLATDRSIRRINDDEMFNSQFSRLSVSDPHESEESNISHSLESINNSLEIRAPPLPVSLVEHNIPLPLEYSNENNQSVSEYIPATSSIESSNSQQVSSLLDSNELFHENEIPANVYNNTINLQPPPPYNLPYPSQQSELNILQPLILPQSSQQQQEYIYQPPLPSLSTASPSQPSSSPPQKKKSSQQSHQYLPDLPLPSSYMDIDLDTYNLKNPDFTQEDVYEYIKKSKETVKCSKCGKEIKKNESFGKDDYYLCIPCSITEVNDDKKVKQYDWEESIKVKTNKNEVEPPPPVGYRRCKRMKHYKPKWSFIERDKQKGKNKNKVKKNKYALKIEKQCLYCRNFKKRQNLIKKLKIESFDQMKKEYEDENDYLYSRDDEKIYDGYISDDKIFDDDEEEEGEEEDDDDDDDSKLC